MFSTTYLAKNLNATISSSLTAMTATTGSFSSNVNVGGSVTISNGNTLNVGTSGTTSPLNVFGLITGSNGLTISAGASSFQAAAVASLQSSGLITASGGITSANGQTVSVGTSGATSTLSVFGTAAITTLNASSGTISGNFTISNGNTLNVGTTGSTSVLNVFGTANIVNLSVSGTLTLASLTVSGASNLAGLSAGATTLTSLSSGNTTITGTFNAGSATFSTGSTVNVGTAGTTSPLNVFGLITGSNGLIINSGSSTFQGISFTTASANGLITANAGITISSGLFTSSTSGASITGPLTLSSRYILPVATTVSTSYTVISSDYLVEFTAPSGTVTVNLPVLSGNLGRVLIFAKSSTSTAVLSITPNGTDKIDGVNSAVAVPVNSAISLVAATASWLIT